MGEPGGRGGALRSASLRKGGDQEQPGPRLRGPQRGVSKEGWLGDLLPAGQVLWGGFESWQRGLGEGRGNGDGEGRAGERKGLGGGRGEGRGAGTRAPWGVGGGRGSRPLS